MKPLNVFYSYAHEDEKLHDALAKHLTLLKEKKIINPWYDRQINAGEEWENKINENLEKADIILLLISVDFIASEYCWGKEMARSLEMHNKGKAKVIPIIVRPVDWSIAPFAKLQALPKDGKPITLWNNRESAWVDVVQGIKKAVESILEGLPNKPAESPRPVPPAKPKKTAAQKDAAFDQKPGSKLKRVIYDAENKTELPGKVVRKEGDAPSQDVAVNEAYDGLGATYNFFWNVYGRNSIDDKGLPLHATVHYDKKFLNGFWDTKRLVIGDGDGKLFNRFSIAVDIIAKELVIGLLQYQTKLAYWEQAGSLVQSISIIFAVLVKQYALKQTAEEADWLFAAEIFVKRSDRKALLSVSKPGTAYKNHPELGDDPQPAHMHDYITIKEDNGGTHLNSGIPNRAFYLVAIALGGYAWEKAGKIWYEAICDKKLTAQATFKEFAQLTLATSKKLFGKNSDESRAVRYGWELVGVNVG